jgi:hypothetical protein
MRKAGLLILLALASCVPQPLIRPLKPMEIALAPYQDVVTAALTGSLMYENGCLLFRDEASKAYVMPIWPVGSTFNGTAVLFHQPGKTDQHILVTEEFVMEGRQLPWSRLSPTYYEPFQRQCGGAQPFFVASTRPSN